MLFWHFSTQLSFTLTSIALSFIPGETAPVIINKIKSGVFSYNISL